MRKAWFGLALGAGFAMSAQDALAQQSRFDGQWSVEVVTQRGDCDRVYRYPIAIENGRVGYAGQTDFSASGSVSASGVVSGTISRGQDRANVRGRLSGASGSGTWTTSGSRTCAGVWTAEKRG